MFSRFLARRLNQRKMTTQSWINSPAGPKTIHFWAPAWKWSLVFAGIGDYFRFFTFSDFSYFFQTRRKVVPESVGIFDGDWRHLVALFNGCDPQKLGSFFRQLFPSPNWGHSNCTNFALSINSWVQGQFAENINSNLTIAFSQTF